MRVLKLLLCITIIHFSFSRTPGKALTPASLADGSLASTKAVQLRSSSDLKQQRVYTTAAATNSNFGKQLPEGTADMTTSIFNMAKVILGAGVLSLPSGIAMFSDSTQALAPATALLIFMGAVSAYSYSLIGKACKIHNKSTFASAWAASVGDTSAPFIASMITVKTFFACLAYSIILGDAFSNVATSLQLPPFLCDRTNVIVILSAGVITPLNLLKDLSLLKYTSILGVAGVLYNAVFISKRYMDGSYAPGGRFYEDMYVKPSFDQIRPGDRTPFAVFSLVAMIATAFVAHYSASRFWVDLEHRTLPRYNKVVTAAFSFSVLVYAVIMHAGFLTFGGSSLGFVLNNYSSQDSLATVARVAIGLGILFGYPLTFVSLREGAMDLLLPRSHLSSQYSSQQQQLMVTVTMMTMLTIGAARLRDLGKVVAFSGSLIGANLIYTVPAIMNLCSTARFCRDREKGKGGGEYSLQQRLEFCSNVALASMGVLISVIGVYATLV